MRYLNIFLATAAVALPSTFTQKNKVELVEINKSDTNYTGDRRGIEDVDNILRDAQLQWGLQNHIKSLIGDDMARIDPGNELVNLVAQKASGTWKTNSGDVYGYVTVNPKSPYHLKVVMTQKDGALALENDGSKPLESVIFDEFGIMFQADPVRVVNVAGSSEMRLMDTLYRPSIHWRLDPKRVLTRDGNSRGAYVCPAGSTGKNYVYWFDPKNSRRCVGGWPVLLMAADLKQSTI